MQSSLANCVVMYERDDPSSISMFAVFEISPLLTEVTAVFKRVGLTVARGHGVVL